MRLCALARDPTLPAPDARRTQDPDTCESPIAPRAAIAAGAVEHILTIEAMGALIAQVLIATETLPPPAPR